MDNAKADLDAQMYGEPWDQDAMGAELVEKAVGDSPVEFLPLGDRCLIYPVVPDEKRPVDIHIVQMGGQDLPDMGVVCAVGWEVNAAVLEKLEAITNPDHSGLLARAEFLALGDIVAINKFSGMDVPGTNFVLLSRRDVLGKMFGYPVRLRKEADRWDGMEQKHHDPAPMGPRVVTPSGPIIGASR